MFERTRRQMCWYMSSQHTVDRNKDYKCKDSLGYIVRSYLTQGGEGDGSVAEVTTRPNQLPSSLGFSPSRKEGTDLQVVL